MNLRFKELKEAADNGSIDAVFENQFGKFRPFWDQEDFKRAKDSINNAIGRVTIDEAIYFNEEQRYDAVVRSLQMEPAYTFNCKVETSSNHMNFGPVEKISIDITGLSVEEAVAKVKEAYDKRTWLEKAQTAYVSETISKPINRCDCFAAGAQATAAKILDVLVSDPRYESKFVPKTELSDIYKELGIYINTNESPEF